MLSILVVFDNHKRDFFMDINHSVNMYMVSFCITSMITE